MTTHQPSIDRPLPSGEPSSGSIGGRTTLLSLGTAAVVDGTHDDAKVLIGLGKPLAVLAYLVLSPGRTASREHLADILWGDQERGPARHSLRRALSYIRSHAGDWVVSGDDHSCSAAETLGADVTEFNARVDDGQFSRALALYRGDFLADFSSPGCREFEAWAEVERAHLRARAVRAGEALCRQALDHARFPEARHAAERVKEIARSSELGWRLNLEVLIACGDRIGAAAEAARFEAWLDAEEREPEPASRAMLRAALTSTASASRDDQSNGKLLADLVGREQEFSIVLDAYARACTGKTQIIVVTGSAGMGKTRLLESVAQRLRSLRRPTVLVPAYPGERSTEYLFASTVVHEIAGLPGAAGTPVSVTPHLVALDSRLSSQFPASPASLDGPGAMVQRATAVRELLLAVCDEAPLVLLLDDAHWMDDASRQVLSASLARLRDCPLLVVLATRERSVALSTDDRSRTLALAPLSSAQVGALVASLGALPNDATWPRLLQERLAAVSGGVPLYILAALEQLIADGVLELHFGIWSAPDQPRLRDALYRIDTFGARARALPPAAFAVLLACCVAGRPMPRPLVAAIAARIGADTPSLPESLEQLGYLKGDGANITVAHDLLAEAVVAIASGDELARTHRDLGAALTSSDDPQWMRLGVRHFASVGDSSAIAHPLETLIRASPGKQRANPRQLTASIVGRPNNDPLVDSALRLLPLSIRWRRFRGPALAAVGVLALGTVGLATARAWRRPVQESKLELFVQTDPQHTRSAQVALARDGWSTSDPLVARFGRARLDTLPHARTGELMRPGHDEWAIEAHYPDSGGEDVALVSRDGRVRRLTRSRADETPEAWSPDGRLLAIGTSAFSTARFKTLAILDVASGHVRSLGPTDEEASSAAWSPDGTRIAFATGPLGHSGDRICFIAVRAGRRACVEAPELPAVVVGWLSDSRLLVAFGRAQSLDAIDAGSLRRFPTRLRNTRSVNLSPDGRWLAYQLGGEGSGIVHVAPADNLDLARRVSADPSSERSMAVAWNGATNEREYLDTLVIDASGDTAILGAPFQLRARGKSNNGHIMPVRAREWRSLTPGIAHVDSTGTMFPLRGGVAVIELSAGGWRTVQRAVVIAVNSSRVLMGEDWARPLAQRWVPFGHPFPRIVTDSALGRAFLNNGDGEYFSGAYLPHLFDARTGLAVDAIVRVRITRPEHQYLSIFLDGVHTPDRLRQEWNSLTGYLPSRFFDSNSYCGLAYPFHEGSGGSLGMWPMGPLTRRPAAAAPDIAKGIPVRVRLQIFPDRRCGIAVQGERPWVSSTPLLRTDSLYLLLQGSSVATRALVGPITIRSGIPPGVDWRSARREP